MARDKEKQRKAQRRFMHERKEWIAQFKRVPCMDCSNRFPDECMDFDHRENKKFNINASYNRKKEDLLKEIAKCDVVCSNCHRIRTRKRIVLLPVA